jgi:hypothetical protein
LPPQRNQVAVEHDVQVPMSGSRTGPFGLDAAHPPALLLPVS